MTPFDFLELPERPAKPRDLGLTLALDKGLAPRQVEDFMTVAAPYVDLVKLGWGTAVITPELERKLAIYTEAGVPVYFGGTLFELTFLQDRVDAYRRLMDRLGVRHVEVSDGTLEIPHERKLAVIEALAQDFIVLSEVGSKDKADISPPYVWVQRIRDELEAGSWKVICEARESGTAGLFRPNGEIRSGLVDEIVASIDEQHVIYEAPQKAQQVWFIRHSGPNVNLGNIQPEEVIPLETLRLGLRGDTLLDFHQAPVQKPEVTNGR